MSVGSSSAYDVPVRDLRVRDLRDQARIELDSATLAALEVQDGPFAETKEALAGVFVVDVPDLDAALGWAEKCPGAQYGVVEVRPCATSVIDGVWTDGCRL